MRLLSRLPPVLRSAPLAVGVFLLGLGAGAAAIVLAGAGTNKRVVVNRPAQGRSPAPDAAYGSVVPANAAASFSSLAARLPGQTGLAVGPLAAGRIKVFGGVQAGRAWSTMKVPVLVTLLADLEHAGRTLPGQSQADAALALEQSDNAAAEALFGQLERSHGGLVGASRAVQKTLQRAGDQTTTINTAPNPYGFTTWGQSSWSMTGEVEFYRALARGCLLAGRDTAYVLSLMRNVVSSQRWGAGSAGYPVGLPLAFKAGWGPEIPSGNRYLVRQSAIIGSGGRGYVISMIALPADGSFAQGVSMITALASWAREHLDLRASRPAATCGSGS